MIDYDIKGKDSLSFHKSSGNIIFLYNVDVQSIQDHIGLAKYIKNHNPQIARLGPKVYMIWVRMGFYGLNGCLSPKFTLKQN